MAEAESKIDELERDNHRLRIFLLLTSVALHGISTSDAHHVDWKHCDDIFCATSRGLIGRLDAYPVTWGD